MKFKDSDAKRQIRRSNGSRLMHVIKPAGNTRVVGAGMLSLAAQKEVK